MSTKNIVPRANGEGGIGTSIKKWLAGWFKTLNAETSNLGDITSGQFKTDIEPDAADTRSIGLLRRILGAFIKNITTDSITLGGDQRIAWPAAGSGSQSLTEVLSNGPEGNIPSGQDFALKDNTGVTTYFRLAEDTGKVEVVDLDGMLGNINDSLLHIPMRRANDALRLSGSETFTRTTTGTYVDPQDGLLKSAAIDTPRYERMADGGVGILIEGASTNKTLHSADFTNVAWVKTNCTAAKDATGIDGQSNSASTLTATSATATCLQAITIASALQTYSVYVKRKTGSGTIEMTIDGGTSWTDITSSLSSSVFTRLTLDQTLANPQIGFRIATSDDEIEVDANQIEELSLASSYIPTTTAAVTRGADDYSVDFGGNIQKPSGAEAWLCDIDMIGKRDSDDHQYALAVVGEVDRTIRTNHRFAAAAWAIYYGNNNFQSSDVLSANIVYRLGMVHDGTNFHLWQDGVAMTQKTSTAITGSGTKISIGNSNGAKHLFGHIRNLRLYDKALTDNEMKAA